MTFYIVYAVNATLRFSMTHTHKMFSLFVMVKYWTYFGKTNKISLVNNKVNANNFMLVFIQHGATR